MSDERIEHVNYTGPEDGFADYLRDQFSARLGDAVIAALLGIDVIRSESWSLDSVGAACTIVFRGDTPIALGLIEGSGRDKNGETQPSMLTTSEPEEIAKQIDLLRMQGFTKYHDSRDGEFNPDEC